MTVGLLFIWCVKISIYDVNVSGAYCIIRLLYYYSLLKLYNNNNYYHSSRREIIGKINYKICTLNFIYTCRIRYLIEMIRKDPPLANLFFVYKRYNPMTATADAPASRIDKKKSSPEKCIFFLSIRFRLTLILTR